MAIGNVEDRLNPQLLFKADFVEPFLQKSNLDFIMSIALMLQQKIANWPDSIKAVKNLQILNDFANISIIAPELVALKLVAIFWSSKQKIVWNIFAASKWVVML